MKPRSRRRLVAIDLRLVEVDEVEDRHEERGHEDGRGDQAGEVQDQDAGQARDESPSKLMDLVVSEVRKQRGDD